MLMCLSRAGMSNGPFLMTVQAKWRERVKSEGKKVREGELERNKKELGKKDLKRKNERLKDKKIKREGDREIE